MSAARETLGDSGAGKSSLIRQLLMQIENRRQTAVVYDPAREYLLQFYNEERGDVVLNPLDARMPYWNPAEEVLNPLEAEAVAKSLFPDRAGANGNIASSSAIGTVGRMKETVHA